MISVALYNQAADAILLETEIRNEAALRTDEHVVVRKLMEKGIIEQFLKEKELTDFIYVDVALQKGISLAETMRVHFPAANIVLIADAAMSPIQYLKPSIMAAALLLKPLQKEMVHQTIEQLFEHFVEKVDNEKVFVVESKEEKQRVPYSEILFFEARAKKVYVCTANYEYGFYDTIEHLEEILPDDFMRCHRSYIVNKAYITKVLISKNTVCLQNDILVPLSRSYKGVMKENVGK